MWGTSRRPYVACMVASEPPPLTFRSQVREKASRKVAEINTVLCYACMAVRPAAVRAMYCTKRRDIEDRVRVLHIWYSDDMYVMHGACVGEKHLPSAPKIRCTWSLFVPAARTYVGWTHENSWGRVRRLNMKGLTLYQTLHGYIRRGAC
jgi:hypothetical protein